MHISKLSLVALLAGALVELPSQAATPEQQAQAVELLRQTIAQQRQAGPTLSPTQPAATPKPTQPAATLSPTPAPAVTPAPQATVPVPAGTDRHEAAIQLLRATQATASTQPAPTMAPGKPRTGGVPKSGARTAAPRGRDAGQTAAPLPETGPKTKQQRLADLLELYRADKMSPTEYQVERAKILAEP
jgi:hypothetical protein